jgi:hypothetical protein
MPWRRQRLLRAGAAAAGEARSRPARLDRLAPKQIPAYGIAYGIGKFKLRFETKQAQAGNFGTPVDRYTGIATAANPKQMSLIRSGCRLPKQVHDVLRQASIRNLLTASQILGFRLKRSAGLEASKRCCHSLSLHGIPIFLTSSNQLNPLTRC